MQGALRERRRSASRRGPSAPAPPRTSRSSASAPAQRISEPAENRRCQTPTAQQTANSDSGSNVGWWRARQHAHPLRGRRGEAALMEPYLARVMSSASAVAAQALDGQWLGRQWSARESCQTDAARAHRVIKTAPTPLRNKTPHTSPIYPAVLHCPPCCSRACVHIEKPYGAWELFQDSNYKTSRLTNCA